MAELAHGSIPLFSAVPLNLALHRQLEEVPDRVSSLDKARFESESDEFLAASVATHLLIEPLQLNESEISVSSEDAKIDISQDPMRALGSRFGPLYVDGLEITFAVPFSGDPELLRCRPDHYSLSIPRAIVDGNELRFSYGCPDRNVDEAKREFERDLNNLRNWLPWVNEQVSGFNLQLEAKVRGQVAGRRQQLERTATDLNRLGFRVRDERPAPIHTEKVVPKAGAGPQAQEISSARAARKPQTTRKLYDVALSFAGEDRDYVDQVAELLREMKIKVFYDRFEQVNLWGVDLAEHLGNVYSEDSRFVVLFVSKHYAQKAWPTHEKRFALANLIGGTRNSLLPVRFDNTEIPGLPPTIGFLDLRVLTPAKLAALIQQKVVIDEDDAH